MSSPLHKQVLKSPIIKKGRKKIEQKSVWVYRLEKKLAEQERRIQYLEDQLDESNLENQKLRNSIPIPSGPISPNESSQFKISL